MNYLDIANKEVIEYFNILEPEFPKWLIEYINTKELLNQQYISITCGTIYTNLFESEFFFSSLDHAISVALIIWHFTKDKKQTLSGLFHDIATPCFKHCVDFFNGDYMTQESTEDLTTQIIFNSPEVMELLNKDNIYLSEIDDYHIYPIADNDTPKLSSDRLEYSLSNAVFTYRLINMDEVKKIYEDIEIQKDEQGIEELGFKTENIAKRFVEITSRLSIIYIEDRTRYSMQFLADIIKRLNEEGKITKNDLYILKEKDVLEMIEKSNYSEVFNIWKNASVVNISKEKPENVYYVHHGSKVRYIDPLILGKRGSKTCLDISKMIEKNLSFDMNNYVYLDFNF